jgi:hypothetical protein
VDEDDFKLTTDPTIRQLKDDVLERGRDVKWSLAILDKMDRHSTLLQRIGQVTTGEFRKLRGELRHVLEPSKLQATIDKRIDAKLEARQDKGFRSALIFVLRNMVLPLALAYVGVKLGLKP